jgi:hypothetical protein
LGAGVERRGNSNLTRIDKLMKVINIYYVRLQSGKNIAQYASSDLPPKLGVILDLSSAGFDGLFEVLNVKETLFIGGYQLITVTVRPSSSWMLDQKTIESGAYYEVHAIDSVQSPTSRSFLGILKGSELLGTGMGSVLRFIIVFAILLYFRRVFKG